MRIKRVLNKKCLLKFINNETISVIVVKEPNLVIVINVLFNCILFQCERNRYSVLQGGLYAGQTDEIYVQTGSSSNTIGSKLLHNYDERINKAVTGKGADT